MLSDVFKTRYQELEASYHALPYQSIAGGGGNYVPGGTWRQWATSSQSLIRAVFGEQSPHYVNFVTQYNACHGGESDVRALHAVFLSAKQDFEGGYVFNVELIISGEVFGDFVSLARHSLAQGHKDVAAVLACAALEDALKRFATSNGLDVTGKTMQDVVNALKGSGLVAGAQKTLLDAMPRIRNLALHAEWTKLSEPEVSSVLGFVEQFLLSKFSGT